ncbi:hypothetical protein SteCoe_13966 [Stentor coeruleus]|uniref:Uncharacterized protein n=1 Tax=Stentor coeruleus TaxID=5963 RepID=A0A1R2C746_9CILI|nr:hypothetical protein SteCoe_13966 [Stentor coeruleus]
MVDINHPLLGVESTATFNERYGHHIPVPTSQEYLLAEIKNYNDEYPMFAKGYLEDGPQGASFGRKFFATLIFILFNLIIGFILLCVWAMLILDLVFLALSIYVIRKAVIISWVWRVQYIEKSYGLDE